MEKTSWEALLTQMLEISPTMDFTGDYSPRRIKLKFKPVLDAKTWEKVSIFITSQGLKIKEENGLVIIYEPFLARIK